jgi:hypothetical protein
MVVVTGDVLQRARPSVDYFGGGDPVGLITGDFPT